MADCATTLNPGEMYRRRWPLLAILIAAHSIFNLTLNPMGVSADDVSERLALPLMGVLLAQPVLFAIWAALGPGPAVMRIPLSVAAATIVLFASIPRQLNVFSGSDSSYTELDGQSMMMYVAFFGVALAVLLIAQKLTGWRIDVPSERPIGNNDTNQFSLKYLLVLTAVCAMLLAAGRQLAGGAFWSDSSFWREVISNVFTSAGFFLLALFPILIIPLIAIARRPSRYVFVAVPFLWAGLTWLAVEVLVGFGEPRTDLARQIVLLQGGAAAAALLSAITVRCAGYRLLSARTNLTPTPATSI